MTTINYKINNQTSRELIATDWDSAKILKEKTQAEELAQLNFWGITAVVKNNDGTITMCGVDENGVPVTYDENLKIVPYVDTTVAPSI
jgi:hypothetical protein